MSGRVKELVSTLENDVNVRTRNLEIASEIARDAVQLQDINNLLQRTVDAIRDRFNFYHAQVFLVDAARENAVLITSTGEVGKLLLERKHKLAVGSDSIVGQVTSKGRTFITLDTERSEVPHRFNPLLPRTRSEMALPLRRETIIGALDIQSVEPNAFDSETCRSSKRWLTRSPARCKTRGCSKRRRSFAADRRTQPPIDCPLVG